MSLKHSCTLIVPIHDAVIHAPLERLQMRSLLNPLARRIATRTDVVFEDLAARV
jgi:hypothetical protein